MMDALTRDRMLLLAGIEVRALPVVEVVEDEVDDFSDLEDEPEVWARHRQLELLGVELRAQARIPKGFEGGGRFRKLSDTVFKALKDWAKGDGPDDPFDAMDLSPDPKLRRDQLRRVAKERGITLRRGATENEIKNALLDDVRKGGKDEGADEAPSEAPAKKTDANTPAKKGDEPDKRAPAKKTTPGKAATKKTTKPKYPEFPDNPDLPSANTGQAALDAAVNKEDVPDMLRAAGVPEYQVLQAQLQLSHYQGSRFANLNEYLYGLPQGDIGRMQAEELLEGITPVFEHSRLDDDVLVFRGSKTGLSRDLGDDSGDLTGKEFAAKGFWSTSANQEIAEGFGRSAKGDGQPTVMRIRAARGTPALSLSRNFDSGNPDNVSEAEIVLGRDVRYRVARDYGIGEDGVRRLDVEVVPAEPDSDSKTGKPAEHTPREAKVRKAAQDVKKLDTQAEIMSYLNDAELSTVEMDALSDELGIPSAKGSAEDKARKIAVKLATKKAVEAYVPRHIQEVLDFLDGKRKPSLPLSVLYSTVNRVSYERYFTPDQRRTVLDQLRGIHANLPEGAAEDRRLIERVIGDLESIDGPSTQAKLPGEPIDPEAHAPREAKVRKAAEDLKGLGSESEILDYLDQAGLSTVEMDALGDELGIPSPRGSVEDKARRFASKLAGKAPAKKATPGKVIADATPERQADAKVAVKAYVAGGTIQSVADDMGKSPSYVRQLLVESGLQLRAPGGSRPKRVDEPSLGDFQEQAARDRQAQIDDKRKVSSALVEVEELLANDASDKALRHRLESMSRRLGTPDALREEMLAAIPHPTGEGGLSSDPAVREVQVENRIRAAYRAVKARPFTPESNVDLRQSGWLRMADLREELGDDLPRNEVDKALIRLAVRDGNAIPESAQWLLRPKDRAGALQMGGQQKHWLMLDDPSPRPVPYDKAKLQQILDRVAGEQGLTKTAAVGTPLRFDRKMHTPIGSGLRDGTPVLVVRPGFQMQRDGKTIAVENTVVEEIDEDLYQRLVAERAPATPEAPTGDLTRLTVVQLKDRLRQLGLPVSGKKADLIARLGNAPAIRDRVLAWETRAMGADITPGNDQLHHYWTRGKGLAKWRFSPHPWTTLVGLLTEHVGPQKAKVFASKWFKEVFGYWSGERKGDNPVGPG